MLVLEKATSDLRIGRLTTFTSLSLSNMNCSSVVRPGRYSLSLNPTESGHVTWSIDSCRERTVALHCDENSCWWSKIIRNAGEPSVRRRPDRFRPLGYLQKGRSPIPRQLISAVACWPEPTAFHEPEGDGTSHLDIAEGTHGALRGRFAVATLNELAMMHHISARHRTSKR